MPVLLLPKVQDGMAIPQLERRLEAAFNGVGPELLALGRDLSTDPLAILAHAPSCAANISDLALMLAWTRLVDELAAEDCETVIPCPDPWLFRHLQQRPGVRAPFPAPPLAMRSFKLACRGFLARAKVSVRMAMACLTLPKGGKQGHPAVLVYGHPASRADGFDAYFGPLMTEFPTLERLLHVDCPPATAQRLAGQRTHSLHAFGSPWAALMLWRARWKPKASGPHEWLIRRAAALEGSGGQSAMIAWQAHCQRRWLGQKRPRIVAWPWENHGWERDFVRACRGLGIATMGYQHTTIGQQEWNHSARSNPDDSLPDAILCVGPADRDRLISMDHSPHRLTIGGALRFSATAIPAYDSAAPIFVALPFDAAIAAEIVDAIRPLAQSGLHFVVKDHPMSPFPIIPSRGVELAICGLAQIPAVSAVIYAATAVGLEAVLAGLPTLRFLPRCRPVINILPQGITIPAATAAELGQTLAALTKPPALAREHVFAAVDRDVWANIIKVHPQQARAASHLWTALSRKLGNIASDPTLQRWLVERALGRTSGPPPFTPHRPPKLTAVDFDLGTAPPPSGFQTILGNDQPQAVLSLALPGADIVLNPGEAGALFDQDFPDLETCLAVHRFAWLPQMPDVDPAWVVALWREWRGRFGIPDDSWAWHPYTAAERGIALVNYARRVGLPGPREETLAVLSAHIPAIAARLEYSGEHYTGNHLTNNGRGLWHLGLALGWEQGAALGAKILLTEAERIITPNGILREGSSHYQLLLTRNYLDCWLAARSHHRPEAQALGEIAARMMNAAGMFALPGGLPLVGDISPDCPPAFLTGILPSGSGGWWDLLDSAERDAINSLRRDHAPSAADGWLRADLGEWAGLWYAAPDGWPFMPGHGHQDLGSAEIHWCGLPLFIDPGRGGYGEDGEAALYRSAAIHGLLQVDGADPTSANRPYYSDSFRRRAGGGPPELTAKPGEVQLIHHGFSRQKVDTVERVWNFSEKLVIDDKVSGSGRHTLCRRLVTPWPVEVTDETAIITTPKGKLRVSADVPLTTRPITHWSAYGRGTPATAIEAQASAPLPWRGRMCVERA